MPITPRSLDDVRSVTPIIGLEVHVELATRTKLFTRVGSPAHPDFENAGPNELVDPLVLALPGSLPVINKQAVRLAALVGRALGCSIADVTKWDRKSYFYPDLPKAYQISQYDMPLCFDGECRWPIGDEQPDGARATVPIRIERAHLEEDAGKLLHEAPADMPELRSELRGAAGAASIVDLNRAGTPLLEIVTAPDFADVEHLVAFCQHLQRVVRWLGASEADMQKGHMRFEPNVNCVLDLDAGRRVTTPISEIKNLNSFRAVRDAVNAELAAQPKRWVQEGAEFGPGSKSTWGWDDAAGRPFLMRAKEDAHDYRYFPDPDLPPIRLPGSMVDAVDATLRERSLPHERADTYRNAFGLDASAAATLSESFAESRLFDAALDAMVAEAAEPGRGGLARERAAKPLANLLLQQGRALAKERGERDASVAELPIAPNQWAGVARLRDEDAIDSSAAATLLAHLADPADPADPAESADAADAAADRLQLRKVKDDAALERWVDETLSDPANEKSVADVRAGKNAAIGRLIGGVMQRSKGQADAKRVREIITRRLGS